MRPPLHAIAPSQSTLRYLRQILFPRLYGYRPTMATNCIRIQHTREGGFSKQRCFHYGVLGVGGGGKIQEDMASFSSSPLVSPVERVAVKNGIWSRKKKRTNWASSAIRQKPRRQIKQRVDPSWHYQSSRLIYEKRLNEAVDKWLDAKDRNADEQTVKRLGIALMKAFNRSERARGTPHIFHLMASTHPRSIDTRCLNLCMEAYLLNNRPSKLVQVFKRYQGLIKPDHMTINIILRNFIAMKQLGKAEDLLKILLESHGPVTPSSFAILLHGVKETTGDFEEMRRIFGWIKTTKLSLHASIYNIMIKMALDCSRYNLAREYAEEMVVRGLGYNTDTFVLFLSTQSKARDWEGVARTMRRMQEYNIILSTEGFNTLLQSYATTADLPPTERFFESMLSYNITPDIFSFNIMIHASIRAKDEEAKDRWFHRMRSSGVTPNAVTFNILFHELHQAKAEPSILRRLYNAASDIDPNLVDNMTKAMLLDSMFKDSVAYERRRKRRRLNPLLLKDDIFLPEIQKMESAVDANRPHNAICIFSDIVSRGLKPSNFLTAAAIRASFRLPESEQDEVSRLLYITRSRGVPVNEVVMTVIASNEQPYPEPSPQQLNAMLQRIHASYEFMGRSYLPISHYVLVQSAWQLIQSEDPHGAIFLMNKISNTRWSSPWNIVGLTVLLKAYTVINDLKGMAWIVDTIEAQEELPDKTFIRYLRRAKEGAESQDDEGFIGWLLVRCIRLKYELKERRMDEKAREVLKFFEGREGGKRAGVNV